MNALSSREGGGGMLARCRTDGPCVAPRAGAVAGMILAVLPILMSVIKLRGVFIALTPALSKMLLFELSLLQGVVALVAAGAACGLAGALLFILPRRVRRPILSRTCGCRAGSLPPMATGSTTA